MRDSYAFPSQYIQSFENWNLVWTVITIEYNSPVELVE